MDFKEPTDKELSSLMREVAHEAKEKATLVKKQLNETIAMEIAKMQIKLHAQKV